jgi:quinoprotein glucose dehydrogenase
MQPSLATIDVNGTPTPAAVVVGKTAMIYAFERATGKPLIELEEREVPSSDVPGEALSKTQPFSSYPPFTSHAALTEDDAFGLLWFDKRACAKTIESFRSEGIFTPPSLEGTLQYPGYAGGANWGGVAIDPERQIAVANVMQLPGLVRLIPRDEFDATYASGELEGWQISRQTGTPYLMARRVFLSPLGMPCIKPPWGKLVAMDLRAGKILWDEPLGTIEDVAPAPVPNFKWGVPNMGGAILTASGLVIIGSAADYYLRIFDVGSGRELWQARLPTAAHATPATFKMDDKQYIVVAVGGHSGLGSPPGDHLMAWRLKD